MAAGSVRRTGPFRSTRLLAAAELTGVEHRLRPINGLLALCQHGELNPSPLAAAGFQVVGFESPVGLEGNRVVVDVVLFQSSSGLFVACESKSGANIEVEQARKYVRIDPKSLVDATSTDLSGARPTVSVLYACLAEHADRIRQGLTAAEVRVAVLAVGANHAELLDVGLGPAVVASAMSPPRVELPFGLPRIVPCDGDSARDLIRPHVEAVLVQHLAQRDTLVPISVLAHETLRQLALYGEAARREFQQKVEACARDIAATSRATYTYVPGQRGSASREPFVRFEGSPEDNDNRGRTQAYQALARRGQPRRRPRLPDPDQLDLFEALGAPEIDDEHTDPGPDDRDDAVLNTGEEEGP